MKFAPIALLALSSLAFNAQAAEQKVKIIKQAVEQPSILAMIIDSFKPRF